LELIFASDGEPADLEAVQATDTVITRKDTIAKNSFMITMMP